MYKDAPKAVLRTIFPHLLLVLPFCLCLLFLQVYPQQTSHPVCGKNKLLHTILYIIFTVNTTSNIYCLNKTAEFSSMNISRYLSGKVHRLRTGCYWLKEVFVVAKQFFYLFVFIFQALSK